MCGLPGVLNCRLTSDAVVVVATPGTDTRLLRARVQVVCADAGDPRPVEVRTAAVATAGSGWLGALARGRAGSPLAVAAASVMVMAAIAFLPGTPTATDDEGTAQVAAPAATGGSEAVPTPVSRPRPVGTPFGSVVAGGDNGTEVLRGGPGSVPEGVAPAGGPGVVFGPTTVTAAGVSTGLAGVAPSPPLVDTAGIAAPVVAVPIGPAVPAPLPLPAAPAPAPSAEEGAPEATTPARAAPADATRKAVGRKVKEASITTVAVGVEEPAPARSPAAAVDAAVADGPGRSDAAGPPKQTGQDKGKAKG